MAYTIVGLGNPGKEYEGTRHNTGRIMLEHFQHAQKFTEWENNKTLKARVSSGTIGKEKIVLIEPETFMNKSGLSLKTLITSPKKAETMIVIYDDLDLPFGSFKISYNRGSGGHHGLESVAKVVKTDAFIRIRVGICPTTPSGKLKKPHGDKIIGDFILEPFKKGDQETLKKVQKKVSEAILMIIEEGKDKAMGVFNQG